MVRGLLAGALACSGVVPSAGAAAGNIAPMATAGSSSDFSPEYSAANAIDGVIGIVDKGEWACKGRTAFWGMVAYPTLRLTWSTEQRIDRVVLYDRPALAEHTAGVRLEFSDGSIERVFAIRNDGRGTEIKFTPRTVTWVQASVVDGLGQNLGLSEIEVFRHEPDGADLAGWVDPTIETARGRWFFCTPGSRPFGMVAAAPYTRNKNQWGGGYNYNSTEILGFAQIHGWIMSGIGLMPTTGGVDPTGGEQGWKSSFSHESEIIRPGYQRVYLDRYKTWVEMTSTDRVAVYRLTSTIDADADILLKLGGWIGSVTMVDAAVERITDTRIEGSIGTTDRLWGGPLLTRVFFVTDFDRPFSRLDSWHGTQLREDVAGLEAPIDPKRAGLELRERLFKDRQEDQAGVSARYRLKAGEPLLVKIAVSYTSVENARANLKAECDHGDFDTVRRDARDEWNRWLGRIKVAGGTHEQRVKFYTDLWHVLLGRHKTDDVSGDYPVYMDERPSPRAKSGLRVKTVRTGPSGKPLHHMYNFDALWLTMWNLNVLWGLGWPEMLDELSACVMQYAENGGRCPRGPSAGGYTYIMVGSPATSLVACTYQKGLLRKVDAESAFARLKKDHGPDGMMGASAYYREHGWQPGEPGRGVEFAFEDWALAQMARKLGKEDDYRTLMKRSAGWPAYYNPKLGLLMPRQEDGSWAHENPLSGRGWVEANAWQGSFSVSHDIAKLAELMGGNDKLAEKLGFAFEQAQGTDFVFGYGAGYVSYANQPGCSNAHVFNHAAHPWLSQYWVRRVNEQAYGGTTPDVGYGGHDEDQGQMGAISALMSLGLFSLRGTCAQEPIYEITSPVFDEITIELNPRYYAGREFKIKTYNNSRENLFIQKAELNDEPLDNCWFYHRDFAKGGLLELWLGPKPQREWGAGPAHR